MKVKVCLLIAMLCIILSSCGPAKPTFDIYGSPGTLYYGGTCPAPVLYLAVMGPGEGLVINSIVAGYVLYDGSGKKISEDGFNLDPVSGAKDVFYNGWRTLTVPVGEGPYAAVEDFGDGRVDFAATVHVKILSPSPSGPSETFYFTSTKSNPVLPCSPATPTPTVKVPLGLPPVATVLPPRLDVTIVPPGSSNKPKQGGGGPPSCSVDPNNPSCVPGP